VEAVSKPVLSQSKGVRVCNDLLHLPHPFG